ncbi:PREDICTED: putative cell wall protein [Tarenaya hassleriana]|uniref:putative cell wall protein n=1 Tax=Tarenaya hassleriana TaxID=28532 RepID=UPI00053C3DD4|nr:PREDICTED: putative cell wall protein [Tarenaya hassleriana]
MASLLVRVAIFSLVLVFLEEVNGKRKDPDVKHPDFLVTIEPQPTVLVPGLGRYLLPPKCKKPFYPYNPVTGAPLTGGSIGGQIPYGGGQGTGTRTQIPGGDDTLVPNPGYEVPTPSSGGGSQVPPVPLP